MPPGLRSYYTGSVALGHAPDAPDPVPARAAAGGACPAAALGLKEAGHGTRGSGDGAATFGRALVFIRDMVGPRRLTDA